MEYKLYHCVTSRANNEIDALYSILNNGLRIRDNGETNGIWFSIEPFKNPLTTPLIVSIDVTEENIEKFGITDPDSCQAIAHRNIPRDYLNIESVAIMCTSTGFVHNTNKF